MKNDAVHRKVKIISEIHPQHHGSIIELKRHIYLSFLGGADMIKVQLYSSKRLFNNLDREYLEISFDELKAIKEMCDNLSIVLFASIFDSEKIEWCEKLKFNYYKIASRTVADTNLCKEILSLKKTTFISLGMQKDLNKVPFNNENAIYFYCVSNYPADLSEINMPDFKNSIFKGYSDHTIGISACKFAISKGAQFIEKHFSTNNAYKVKTEQAHYGSMNDQDLYKLRNFADDISLMDQ